MSEITEVKKSWNVFKVAMADYDAGEISKKDLGKYYDAFYSDVDPIIENLGEDDE